MVMVESMVVAKSHTQKIKAMLKAKGYPRFKPLNDKDLESEDIKIGSQIMGKVSIHKDLSKDLGGRVAKVPKPPKGAGLLKS